MPSERSSKRGNATEEDGLLVALRGIGWLVFTSVMLTLLDFSSSTLVGVNVVLGAIVGHRTYRAFLAQQQRLDDFRRKHLGELQEWQDRWQRLHRETQDTTSALVRMRDGVVMLGESNQILLMNPAAKRLLGTSESINTADRSFGETVRQPELNRAIRAAYSGDGSQKLKLEIQDGETTRPLKIRIDHFGVVPDKHLLITVRDETESHQVEAMRREFIANISHELKTPLAAIKGYAETVELAINDDPEAASHFMSQIQTQCLRLERLIADMMQLARAQAGPSRLNIANISLEQPIQESLKSLSHVAQTKNIEIRFISPESPPLVRGDSEALLTIANNLISNAVRYTHENGTITISCRDAGNNWALVVEDTGIGIDAKDQKRIFERFYRVDKRSDSPDGGTGIGLSIVKNLAITLGGEVRVSSYPGRGSKFEVLLPKA